MRSREIKNTRTDGKELFLELANINTETLTSLERAVRFFVLNRISFSGTIESGGYSQESFCDRFTQSSIDRLKLIPSLLEGVKITNLDYSEVVEAPTESAFIYLDPLYWKATKSKLYGKRGDLHTSFDHQRFSEMMQKCSHQWLITYDDSPVIRENFSFANIREFQLQYEMNNYRQKTAAKGQELIIKNVVATNP